MDELAAMREKNERNARVQARYNELMREGRHGHYETMFRVVREEVERALSEAVDDVKRLRALLVQIREVCDDNAAAACNQAMALAFVRGVAAGASEQQAQPKHADRSTPCPMCGFVVREVERRPFVFRDEDEDER